MRRLDVSWDRAWSRRTVIRAAGTLALAALPAARRALAAPATPAAAPAGAGWTVFHGDPARTGVVVGPGPGPLPELRWRFETGLSSAMAAPVVADGVVYVFAGVLEEGSVFAIDLATGRSSSWLTTDIQMLGASPAVADGVIYLAGMKGEILALDLASQQPRWRASLDAATSSSPLIADGLLLVGADDDHLRAFDVASGKERWRVKVGKGSTYTLGPSPAVADGVAFYAGASKEGELVAVDLASGKERWRFRPDRPGLGTPAIAGGTVYVGGDAGDVYALDAASGKERWRAGAGAVWTTPAVTDDVVLVQAMNGILTALDRASGETRWTADTGASWSSPVVAGGTVYVGNGGLAFEQGLHALDVRGGTPRWQMKGVGALTSSVAIAGDLLVLAADDGAVYGITGSDGGALERGTDGKDVFIGPVDFIPNGESEDAVSGPDAALDEEVVKLTAAFAFVGMAEGAAWEAAWTRDGEAMGTRSVTWAEGPAGRATETISVDTGSLEPGRYTIELRVDGTPVRRAEVVIG